MSLKLNLKKFTASFHDKLFVLYISGSCDKFCPY